MRPRAYSDLLGLLRAACTHASHSGRELPVLPFYVREHVVGWLRPSFADLLRRWPHVFEVNDAYVSLRASPDTAAGRTAALAEVIKELHRDGVLTVTASIWRPIWSSCGQACGCSRIPRAPTSAR